MTSDKAKIAAKIGSKLKHPHLFVAVLVLFGIDLAVPDAIPFADEILLGLTTVLLGSWRTRKEARLEGKDEPAALPPPDDDED